MHAYESRLDSKNNCDVPIFEPQTLRTVGDAELGGDTDRTGTGERRAADGDSTLVDSGDIEPDRIIDPAEGDIDGREEDPPA